MNHHDRATNSAQHRVETNRYNTCPPEILQHIIGVHVLYLAFDGFDKQGIIEVHEDLEQDVRDFFTLAYDIGFPLSRVSPASKAKKPFDDDDMMAQNMSSGFNYRTVAGSDQLSLHALGRAIDINPKLNPCHLYENGELTETKPGNWRYHSEAPFGGVFDTDHPLVELMRSRGWEWGGDWTPESGRVDLHHFQKAE